MNHLPVRNPFNAPVYHEETIGSTMDVSRILASQGEGHGTVIVADFQEAGRGRVHGRSWETEKGSSLLFTILLRYPGPQDIPPVLTLRTGLAVALAIEVFAPALAGRIMIKWPNDILISGKKAAGILAEADGGNVHIGIGVNVAQWKFPKHLRDKAASVGLASGGEIDSVDRFALLGMILARLYDEIEKADASGVDWKSRIEARLYKKGEQVNFSVGAADSGNTVSGTLAGIGEGGELLILPAGEITPRSFLTGELMLHSFHA